MNWISWLFRLDIYYFTVRGTYENCHLFVIFHWSIIYIQKSVHIIKSMNSHKHPWNQNTEQSVEFPFMVPSSHVTPKINDYPDFCILYINGIIMYAFSSISGSFCSIVQIWDSYILVWIVVHSSFTFLYSIPLCNYNKCIHPVHCCWALE